MEMGERSENGKSREMRWENKENEMQKAVLNSYYPLYSKQ